MDLPCAVGGEDGHRGHLGADGAQLRDGDLPVSQHLQEEGLELFVRPVQFVNEEDGGAAIAHLQGLEEGALEEELGAEDLPAQTRAVAFAGGLQEAHLQHLAGVVPFIDSGGQVQPLVALEADEAAAQATGQGAGHLRLADARLSLQEEGPLQLEGQEDGYRQPPLGDVALLAEGARHLLRRGEAVPR